MATVIVKKMLVVLMLVGLPVMGKKMLMGHEDVLNVTNVGVFRDKDYKKLQFNVRFDSPLGRSSTLSQLQLNCENNPDTIVPFMTASPSRRWDLLSDFITQEGKDWDKWNKQTEDYRIMSKEVHSVARMLNEIYAKDGYLIQSRNWSQVVSALKSRLFVPFDEQEREVLFKVQSVMPEYDIEDIILNSQFVIWRCKETVDEAGFPVFYFSGEIRIPAELQKVVDLPVVVENKFKVKDVFPKCLYYIENKAMDCSESCVTQKVVRPLVKLESTRLQENQDKTLCNFRTVTEANCHPEDRSGCETQVTKIDQGHCTFTGTIGGYSFFDGLQNYSIFTPFNGIEQPVDLGGPGLVAIRAGEGEVIEACGKNIHYQSENDYNSPYRTYTPVKKNSLKGVHQIDDLLILLNQQTVQENSYVCYGATKDSVITEYDADFCSIGLAYGSLAVVGIVVPPGFVVLIVWLLSRCIRNKWQTSKQVRRRKTQATDDLPQV